MSNDYDPANVGKPPEHLVKESRAADKVDKERAELFAVMIKTPAWLAYQSLLQSRIETAGMKVLDPAGSVDGAMLLEYEKGTMRGLLIAKDLPSIIIEQSKSLTSAPDTEETS